MNRCERCGSTRDVKTKLGPIEARCDVMGRDAALLIVGRMETPMTLCSVCVAGLYGAVMDYLTQRPAQRIESSHMPAAQ